MKLEDDKVIESPFILFKLNVSEDEFWSFAHEDLNCELLDGVLVIHSPANQEHEDIFGYLYTLFRLYLDITGNGKVLGSRFVMHLAPKWNPEPDILVVKPEKFSNLKESRLEGPADLIIEILSDATRDVDLNKKLPYYLTSGVGEVWIVDPDSKKITIHGTGRVESYSDPDSTEIIRSKIFPDLAIQVRWIWNRNDYSAMKMSKELVLKR
ncbi:MAG: Uma2 family endonuclease [Candidatus Sigynarchaeum springense]